LSALELSSLERKFLRGLAHELDPLVLVGKGGLSEGVVETIHQALESHELVKVKFNDFKSQRKELAAEVVERTGAALVGAIGHVVVLFRPSSDEKKRKIVLPKGSRRRQAAAPAVADEGAGEE